jgi:DNA-binding transcriptional LysR family regulator
MGYLPLAGTLVTPSGICQAHPGLDLRLQTALSAEVSALVLRGDAALGLRYGTDPGLVSVIIHHERLVPVCPPGHPYRPARPITTPRLRMQHRGVCCNLVLSRLS